MADDSELGAIYLSRHGTQAKLMEAQATGAEERPPGPGTPITGSVERQANMGEPSPMDAAAQGGVPIAPITPAGAPNLPPMVPPGTRVPVVPPGFRGDEPSPPGRPRMAPTPQMRPNAGIGAKGLLETVAEQLPDIPGAYGPFSVQEVKALAQGLDYIGSVLNVPYEAGATALVSTAQPYFEYLAQQGVPSEQIVKMQESLSAGFQMIGALAFPGEAGGLNLANPETAAAIVKGVGTVAKAVSGMVPERVASAMVAAHPNAFQPVVEALRVKGTEEGGIAVAVVTTMARALAGMVTGSFIGETQEDQARNALIGLGLGAVASPALIRRMVRGARELAAVAPSALEAEISHTFTTAKGSTYTVHSDGTTTRIKAARPEHPGDVGQKERSLQTWYVTEDQMNKLSEITTRGAVKKELAQLPDGRVGMRYREGPNAGKWEGRTVVQPAPGPAMGLHPIEIWADGSTHFGNKIVSITEGTAPAVESPHVSVLPATDIEKTAFLTATGEAVPLGDRLAQVNWATIRDPESIDAVTDALIKARPVVKTVLTHEESRAMATEMGLTTQQVLDTMETQGGWSARVQAKKDLYVASRNKLGAMAEQLDALVEGSPGYAEGDAAFRQQFGVATALLQKFLDDSSDTGRAMNLLRQAPQEMGDVAGMAAMIGKDVSAVPTDTLVAQVKSLTAKGPEAQTTYLQRLGKVTSLTLQTANWAYVHALLSTFEGSIANTLQNLTQLAEFPLLRLGSAAIGSMREAKMRMLGQEGELASRTYWGSPIAEVVGNVVAIPEMFGAALDMLHAGQTSRFGGIAKEAGTVALGTQGKGKYFRPTGDPTTWTGAAINLIASMVEFPNRLMMMAPDEMVKILQYRGETWAQAYNMVEKEFGGMLFAPLRKTEPSVQLVMKDTLGTARERFVEIIRNPDRIMQQVATGKTESVGDIARQAANRRTLNEPLTGRLKSLTDSLSHPITRMTVAPFQKTPINSLRYQFEHVPVLGLLVERARGDWNAGGEPKDMLLAKWALAGGMMTWASMKALSGEITGGGPLDPDLNQLWQQQGYQRYAVVTADGTVLSYNRFEGLGSLVGLVAEYTQLRGYIRQDEADQIASAIVLTVADNMLSKTFMRSAAELMNLLMSRAPKDLQKNRFLKSFIASYVPSGMAQAERYIDPTIRATYGMLDEVKARVAGFSAELPPRLEWLRGEPKLAPPGWHPDWMPGFVSMLSPIRVTHLQHDRVIQKLLDLDVSISTPPPYLWGGDPDTLRLPNPNDGIPLDPTQHYYYIRGAAKTAVPNKVPGEHEKTPRTQYEQLDALIQTPWFNSLTPATQTNEIHKTVTAYRKNAQLLTLKKFPDLQQAYADKFENRGAAILGESHRPKLHEGAQKLIQGLTR